MKKNLFFVLILFVFNFFASAQMLTKNALIISNYNYDGSKISTAEKDGYNVSKLLHKMGFTVMYNDNVSQNGFAGSVKTFVSNSTNSDVVLFYYRGYAAQSGGKNYLIPTDADILTEPDINMLGIKLDDVVESLNRTGAEKILLFLDCCDETPWQRLLSNSKGGLAYMMLPQNKEITLMTAQALNKNTHTELSSSSLFTKYFLEEFGKPDTDIRATCANISAKVRSYSGGLQVPWINSTISSSLVLTGDKQTLKQTQEEPEITEAVAVAEEPVPEEIPVDVAAVAAATEIINLSENPEVDAFDGNLFEDDFFEEPVEIVSKEKQKDKPLIIIHRDNLHNENVSDDGVDIFAKSEKSDGKITETKLRAVRPKSNLHEYKIAFFGVKYDLYKDVYDWASSSERSYKAYRFNKLLTEEEYENISFKKIDLSKPIKDTNLLDALMWTNAYSEYFELPPVYYDVPDDVVLRSVKSKSVSVAEHLNQSGYRLSRPAETKYAIDNELINSHYKGYLLAMSDGDLTEYKNPTVKVEKPVSTGLKVTASLLNPILGLGSYIEGDIGAGVGLTIFEGIGIGAGVYGYTLAQKVLAKPSIKQTKEDFLMPNIVIGSGIGVYGIAAIVGFIRPAKHGVMKKKTFTKPASINPSNEYDEEIEEEIEIEFDFEPTVSPDGDLALALTFRW